MSVEASAGEEKFFTFLQLRANTTLPFQNDIVFSHLIFAVSCRKLLLL
jgi:hypothetical protein